MSIDDDFIDRVLEGDVSEGETAAFQEWLKVPANLQRFALRGELHSDLRQSLRRRKIQAAALKANSDASAIARGSAAPTYQASLTGSPKVRLTIAIGLATAACLLIVFLQLRRSEHPVAGNNVAASIVRNVGGQLTKDHRKWDDLQLPAGGYELRKGLLNLQFGGGVMVYVEAPARFDAVSNKRVVLHSGRLSATVPPEGIGFTVDTPEAEVVDFGTEFSVDVEGGASEVHVFDGLVRVSPRASNQRDASKSVDLRASEAVRISGAMPGPVGIAIETNRFIRNFDEPRLNYARAIKRLSPVVYYRMPIRDRGLVSEPAEYSGVVLTGEGKRPPHAKGVFAGGSLRVGVDSTGRGGRVDSPPPLNSGQFSLAVFVYLEEPASNAVIATNLEGGQGNFGLSLDEKGRLRSTIRSSDGDENIAVVGSMLPLKTWRHVVVTADGEQLQLYEDGEPVAVAPCKVMATSHGDAFWLGTDAQANQVWNGRIDEVALFGRALSKGEVAAVYRTAEEEIARTP